MKARKSSKTSGAQAQASWFVARLYSGEMTGKDEDDLVAWLNGDAAHRRAYGEALAIWDAAGELRTDPQLIEAGGMRTRSRGLLRKRPVWTAAAGVLVLVALSVLFANILGRSGDGQVLASYQTAVGEQQTVTLEDGSRLMLNTGSRILVDYTPGERRIILEFGEVFFEVEGEPRRPLTVFAQGRLVKVLGTKFSVLIAGNEVRVAVVDGTVAVGKQEARFPLSNRRTIRTREEPGNAATSGAEGWIDPNDVILRAGTLATFGDGHEPALKQDNEVVERTQSWREGVVRFESEPLFRVVAELNRYSPSKILIEDDAIVNLPISGVFALKRIDLILEALEDVIPVTLIRYSDRYVLVGSKPKSAS